MGKVRSSKVTIPILQKIKMGIQDELCQRPLRTHGRDGTETQGAVQLTLWPALVHTMMQLHHTGHCGETRVCTTSEMSFVLVMFLACDKTS